MGRKGLFLKKKAPQKIRQSREPQTVSLRNGLREFHVCITKIELEEKSCRPAEVFSHRNF